MAFLWFARRGKRFSREEACAAAGTTMEQLLELERERLLVPNLNRWPPWARHEPYYRESQVGVLRHLARRPHG
jgi:hypothetical protein